MLTRLAVLTVVALGLFSTPASGQGRPERPPPPRLPTLTRESLKQKKLDDALARIELAIEQGEREGAPEALLAVARGYFRQEKWDRSLHCLEKILEKFPDAPIASLALLGLGETYSKTGEKEKMVAALERGIAAPRVETKLGIMDASDSRNRAHQLLGQHYIDEQQWDKAIAIYRQWEPRSWCGTCGMQMEADRSNRILFCQIHAGSSAEAARECWKSVRKGKDLEISMFVLVRLYAEANQLDDLRQLSDHFVQEAQAVANESAGGPFSHTERFVLHQERAKSLSRVLALLNSTDWNDAIGQVQQPEDSSQRRDLRAFEVRTVHWHLLRNSDSSLPSIIAAAQANEQHFMELASLLAEDDSETARRALVDLTARDVYRQQNIVGIVRTYCSEPDAVIAQIVQRVPEDRKRYVTIRPEPLPFTAKFNEEWPRPAPGSLPAVRHLKVRQAN